MPATGTPLPNQFYPLLPGTTQPPRAVLTQLSLCDGTVPNAQNTLLSGLLGRKDDGTHVTGYDVPLPASSVLQSHVQWFSQSQFAICPGDMVGHSNPWDFSSPYLAGVAQQSAAQFLLDATLPATPAYNP